MQKENKTTKDYVHGYSSDEGTRLKHQANTLADLLHKNVIYAPGSHILEVGCGIGAQTIILRQNNPNCRFTCIDISLHSILQARLRMEEQNQARVSFVQADISHLPFKDHSFDHLFVCFVLEHLADPRKGLTALKRLVKPGGSITVIEGDHGSTSFYPPSALALQTIKCLVDLQARSGGNALIGRQLYPLLAATGFKDICVTPCMAYTDISRPQLIEGFTKNTFIAMVEGVRQEVIVTQLMDEANWDQGIKDLYRTTEEDGVFCYTFFKARGIV